MTIDRWDPFREMLTLRDAMDRLFQESYTRLGRGPGMGAGSLPIDLAEEEDRYVLRASLPGVRPEDVHITVQGNTVTIRAESQAEQERKGQNWLVRERQSGVFQRTLSLPTDINANEAEANFEHGELVLTLPKAESVRPRRIQVASGGATGWLGQGSAAEQHERAVGEVRDGGGPSASGGGSATTGGTSSQVGTQPQPPGGRA